MYVVFRPAFFALVGRVAFSGGLGALFGRVIVVCFHVEWITLAGALSRGFGLRLPGVRRRSDLGYSPGSEYPSRLNLLAGRGALLGRIIQSG